MNAPKITLKGLQADAFRHPLDYEATTALKQLPGFDLVIRNLLAPVAEQYFYLENMAASILVSDRQLPHLHQLLQEAAQILDLEPPALYIRQNPVPNAYTFAMRGKQPFMVIHTALLDLLTLPEIQAVMAHELGHLKCDHGVYLTLANLLVLAAEQIPNWGLTLAQNLQEQLMEWVRCAEFTCDRAALLVSQDPRVVASVLMKLTGGSPQLAAQLNLDAFIDQAKAYDGSSATELGQLIQQLQTAPLTHPLPVLRAREIDRWGSSAMYEELLRSTKSRYNNKAKSLGGWRNW
ncbi:M48 family metallopeptidase [Prochlorothrix hollandica]|uniref:M48 family metallopeptidase n=1 Tax=Prochlorothrix hollandica TaxID=1223 RepID=UPI0004758711|nr:M48 family metallopeptidase [Prochlorothrix hollandica]